MFENSEDIGLAGAPGTPGDTEGADGRASDARVRPADSLPGQQRVKRRALSSDGACSVLWPLFSLPEANFQVSSGQAIHCSWGLRHLLELTSF